MTEENVFEQGLFDEYEGNLFDLEVELQQCPRSCLQTSVEKLIRETRLMLVPKNPLNSECYSVWKTY